MISDRGIALAVTVLMAALGFATAAAAATPPDWIVESNKQAAALLQENAKYSPESASSLGVDGYDDGIFDSKPHTVERQEADLDAVASGYERALPTVTDPRVKQDLQILLK